MAADVAIRMGGGAADFSDHASSSRARLARRRRAKRLLDTGAAAGLFFFWLAACLIVALLIRMIDGGPALLWQERIGLGGRSFRMPKFRTMAGNGGATTAVADARVTRFGRVLRRFHIDEWPQLWSVARGRMSFVGPRPEQPRLAESYAAHLADYELRHLLRPGITGLAQVKAPYAGDLEETRVKLIHDLDYLRRGTLAMDAWILVQTVRVVVKRRGWR